MSLTSRRSGSILCITHRILDGKSWVMLDELKLPGIDSNVGKFGCLSLPGKGQVGLSHLTFKPI